MTILGTPKLFNEYYMNDAVRTVRVSFQFIYLLKHFLKPTKATLILMHLVCL
jgi:hypothetical protein